MISTFQNIPVRLMAVQWQGVSDLPLEVGKEKNTFLLIIKGS